LSNPSNLLALSERKSSQEILDVFDTELFLNEKKMLNWQVKNYRISLSPAFSVTKSNK